MKQKKLKIVFLTGLDLSKESGISTFRGNNGIGNDLDWEFCSSVEGMKMDTTRFLAFYNRRRLQLAQAKPNAAHSMIAELEKDYDVTVITHNEDDLHERAGSTNVFHLKGELTKVCSTKNRQNPKYIRDYPLTTPIRLGDDAGDGSQLRPYVTLFGEHISNMTRAKQIVEGADIFVVVGISIFVYPGAILAECANLHKEIVKYIIDVNDMEAYRTLGYHCIQATPIAGMKTLLDIFSKNHKAI